MKLDARVVLVTGASSGIGAAIARAAAARGAELICVARGREKLEALAAELRSQGTEVSVRPADLANLPEADALASELIESGRVPDVLVNNAGAGRWRAVDENEPGESERQMSVPYLAAFELTRALAPAMIERGSGHVANMTSAAAYFYFPGANGYATARWAMRAFSEHLREDLRGTGVGVTVIVPAEVDSPYFDNNPGSRERVPRPGVPELRHAVEGDRARQQGRPHPPPPGRLRVLGAALPAHDAGARHPHGVAAILRYVPSRPPDLE